MLITKTLRVKIQDEPFIDLIYKYLRTRHKKKSTEKITFTKIGLAKEDPISSYL